MPVKRIKEYECDLCGAREQQRDGNEEPLGWTTVIVSGSGHRCVCPKCGHQIRDQLREPLAVKPQPDVSHILTPGTTAPVKVPLGPRNEG